LAENSDDEHLKKVKQNAEQHAFKMEVASRSVHDEKALFDEDDADEDEIVLGHDNDEPVEEEIDSVQREISKARVTPGFEGLKTTQAGHKIQQVKELMTVPVRISLDYSHIFDYPYALPLSTFLLSLWSKCFVLLYRTRCFPGVLFVASEGDSSLYHLVRNGD
jgi:hypothetical protein